MLLITDLEIGGTPTVVRELAVRLQCHAHVEVACLARWGPVADQLRSAGVLVTAFDATSARDLLSTTRRLVRFIGDSRMDTVFSFLIHANTVAAIASWCTGGVRFIQSIQTTQPNPRWHWLLQRWVHHATDTVVVPSPSVALAASDWADVPAEKIVVIPNAVDAPSDEPVRPTGRRPTRVGFIGRLDPIKRVTDLVEAMSLLDDSHVLHIFGDGEERPRIEQEIGKLSISDRVTLHGTIADPRLAMRQIDVLVLPSQAEGFGLVLIEAMAAGVPVIGTDVQGIRDVIRDGVNGVLAPVADPPALAHAIARIGSSPALRNRLIAGGLRDVRERFDWSAVLPMYRRLLKLDRPWPSERR